MDGTAAQSRRLVLAVSGAILGAAVQLAGLAVFLAMWWLQRVEAPTCFPDEDGVFGTLLCSLAVNVIVIGGVGVVVVRHRPRVPRPFLSGLVGGCLIGLIVA